MFLLFELEIPFHESSPSPSLKRKATSNLQDNQYKIFAVAEVEATLKFVSPKHLKFNLFDTGA